MILQSRMNNINITEGENTHEIVMDKLIELWNEYPERSLYIFKRIAEMIATHETQIPNITLIPSRGAYQVRMRQGGIQHFIGSSVDKQTAENMIVKYSQGNPWADLK